MSDEKPINGIDPTIPNRVIISPKPTDYVSGDGNIDAAIANRVLVPDGNWTPYTPKGERQSGGVFESDDCTAFSYTNCVECQFKYFRKNGQISQSTMDWLSANGYLDENGDLNASDRALGSMAGTTSQGNSLNTVAETARKMGLVPESKWPSVFTNYSEYYKPVPAELQALAKQFLDHFDMPYESVVGDLTGALKAAPLYVALCTCGGWNNPEPPPIAWCNAGSTTNHAVCLLKQKNYRIFDSYDPFVKDFASDYFIPYFYKVLLNPKGIQNMFLANDGGTVYQVVGNGSEQAKIGIADLESLGVFHNEPQVKMDTSHIPEYNIMKKNPNGPGFVIINK